MMEVLALLPRRRAALAVALGSGVVLFGAALLAASGALITGAARRPESLLVLLPLITSVRLFAVGRAALRYAERLVAHDVTLRTVGRVRVRLLERLVPLSPAALVGVRGGELLATLRSDVDELQAAFVRLAQPAAVAVVSGTVAVGLTALVSPALAVVLALLLVLLGAVLPAWAARAGRGPSTAAQDAEAAVGADVLDLVRGLPDHLAGDGGRLALAAIEVHGHRQRRAERATARLTALTTLLREGFPGVGVVLAVALVGPDVVAGRTDPVLLAAAALGVLGAFDAVAPLPGAWSAAGAVRAAGARVRELAARTPAVVEPTTPAAAPSGTTLHLEGVTLTYPGSASPTLAGLDLEVGPGEKVALVGPSGSGKSSVLALALRVRDPDEGCVRLGGTDLRDLALADVRRASAWSAQAPQLLGSTVAANVRLGRRDATDDEVVPVLRDVGLGALVDEGRLDTWIGEGGERLSAGERARVALARALVADAPLLLLDEPTAHLDADSAGRVLDLLSRSPHGVLLVTHAPEALDERWRVVSLS